MATLQDLIGASVEKAVRDAIAANATLFENVAKAGGDAAAGGMLGDVGRISSILTGIVGSIPIIGGLLGDVDPLTAIESAGGKLGNGFGIGYFLGYAAWQFAQPALLPVVHEINHLTENMILDPGTAATMAAQGIISGDQADSEMSGGGFDGEHAGWLREAAQQWPDVGTLLTLMNRQEISPESVALALQRHGYSPGWQRVLMSLSRVLLSPADLALASLRGVIDQTTLDGYSSQLGITADDMAVLIGNTGEPPGVQEMLFAFRRGIITQAVLEDGIRQSRVRDEWIPMIEAMRYVPPSTSDATRAYVQGYITLDQATEIAGQNGTDPTDYQWVAASWGDPISPTEAARAYHRGIFTAAQFKQSLREGRLKDKYIDDVVELSRQLIPYRTLNTLVEHGIKSPEWAIEYLMMDGYAHEDAAALVSTATSGKTAVHKNLAQGMITELYEARAISQADAVSDLEQLGWDEPQALFVLAVLDAKRAVGEQSKAITAARNAYLAGRITDSDVSTQLGEIGVLADQQALLLHDWALELRNRVLELTPTQIADAVKYGAVEWKYAQAKLTALGYTAEDANIVLAATGATVPKDVTIGRIGP